MDILESLGSKKQKYLSHNIFYLHFRRESCHSHLVILLSIQITRLITNWGKTCLGEHSTSQLFRNWVPGSSLRNPRAEEQEVGRQEMPFPISANLTMAENRKPCLDTQDDHFRCKFKKIDG